MSLLAWTGALTLVLGACGAQPPATSSEGPHALLCPGEGAYARSNWTNQCGSFRWDVKTGSDGQAPKISLVPTPTTIASLVGRAAPASLPYATRLVPTETTLFELRDVRLTEVKLESDSDYHLVLSDGTRSMIAEVPYPGCVRSGPFGCFISRARAEVESKVMPNAFAHRVDYTVSIVGVGFFDDLHDQGGVAPNGIELHPALGLCFGDGCDPTAG